MEVNLILLYRQYEVKEYIIVLAKKGRIDAKKFKIRIFKEESCHSKVCRAISGSLSMERCKYRRE
jgi:hypothetical protein